MYSFAINIVAMLEVFFNSIWQGFIFGLPLWALDWFGSLFNVLPYIGYLGCALICAIIVFIKSLPKSPAIKRKEPIQQVQQVQQPAKQNDTINNKNGIVKPFDYKQILK